MKVVGRLQTLRLGDHLLVAVPVANAVGAQLLCQAPVFFNTLLGRRVCRKKAVEEAGRASFGELQEQLL